MGKHYYKKNVSGVTDKKLNFNFEKLNSKHVDISFDENEQYEDLLMKCEQARKELRAYREEISVLRFLRGSIKNFQKWRSDPFRPRSFNYTMGELVTFWTILHTPKYEVKEERIREVLSDVGLPEGYVVAIRRYGTRTQYKLEPDRDKRKELLKIAEEEKIKNEYLRPLNRVAKRFDKNFYVQVDLTEGKPTLLNVEYYRWFHDENEDMRKTILSKLKRGAFKVSQDKWSISANKIIKINGDKTIKELEEIVRKALKESQ